MYGIFFFPLPNESLDLSPKEMLLLSGWIHPFKTHQRRTPLPPHPPPEKVEGGSGKVQESYNQFL